MNRTPLSEAALAEKRLKDAKLRVTLARVRVLTAALHMSDLFSAYDLRAQLETQLDLSTIYRALEAFEASGLIERTGIDKDRRLYRVPRSESAASITALVLCRSCGKIETIEVPAHSLHHEKLALERRGYAGILVRVEFSVECAGGCQMAKPKGA